VSLAFAKTAMMLKPPVSGNEIEAYRTELAALRVGIIGAGRSGMACLRLLGRLAAETVLADVKPLEELRAEAEQAEALGAAVVPEFTQLQQLQRSQRRATAGSRSSASWS